MILAARSEAAELPSRESIVNEIHAGIKRLNETYWSPTLGIWLDRPGDDLRGHFDGTRNPPWWPSANAVEMLIDCMTATGSSDYDSMIGSLYALQKNHAALRARLIAELKRRKQWNEADQQKWQRAAGKNSQTPRTATGYYSDFQNEYLDDSGWWGITWLKMYDRTRAPKYLATARTIHAHMAKNWHPEKGGGVMWSEDADKQRPNAITNGLFLILSARLHERTHADAYRKWAEKTLQWMRDNALYDGIAVVDAPGHAGDYWTYNQGVFIGGLTALYQATGQRQYLDDAVKATETILHRSGLTLSTGVIVEKLGTNGDASLFKGIFVRYLAQLRDLLKNQKLYPEEAEEIDRCIRASVESLLRHAVAKDGLFSAEWHEMAKDRATSFNTQVSGVAALVGCLSPNPKR
jgi:predicted alpha-1,6-mannanase (GH76 family)